MTEAEAKNPGQELRATRERLGLSLQDVALATKINARILKALEEGDRDALPAKSFARGFIRSYAAYLKIDAEPILVAYGAMRTDSGRARFADEPADSSEEGAVAKENQTKENQTQENQMHENKSLAHKSSINERSMASRIAIFAAIFVLVGLIIFVKKLKDKYEREKTTATVTTTLPNGVLAPPVKTISRNNSAKPITTVKPNRPKPILVQPKTLAQSAPPARLKAQPKPVAQTKPVMQTQPASQTQPAKKIVWVTPPNPTQQIIIEALDNVDVTIRVGNSPAQTIHLVPQAVHTIRTNEAVVLNVTDGGMVNIVRNGRDQGVPGQLGKPITLKYP